MAGLEDLLGGILAGAQPPAGGAPGGAPGGAGGGMDPGAMAESLNKVMMVAGPLLAMLAQGGGLQDLLGKLGGAGLGGQADSWVGTGANEPVSADQLAAALPDEVSQIAAQAGLDPSEVSASLSELLPGLVDRVSPNGQLPSSPQDLDQVVSQIPGGESLKSILGPGA